jgi:hypothetical protein
MLKMLRKKRTLNGHYVENVEKKKNVKRPLCAKVLAPLLSHGSFAINLLPSNKRNAVPAGIVCVLHRSGHGTHMATATKTSRHA